MTKLFLKAANALISLIEICLLCLAGIYAVYALWDNQRIYTNAGDIQAEMQEIKPEIQEDGGASFEELLAVNPDVCAWVTLDNTQIDYPVLQGEDNLSYINTDVYGDFALSGSIFLDSRNEKDFSDTFSLLYGHHMEQDLMFGDLDLYADETFFNENFSGTLMLPDRSYQLTVFAYLLTDAGNKNIFEPGQWKNDTVSELFSYLTENSLYLRQETLTKLEQEENPQILAFSTCSSDYTDARTVVLASMKPVVGEEQS